MKHYLSLLLALTLFIFSNPASSRCESEQFTIGAILPLTGAGADVGNAIKNGMELALRELPAEDQKRISVLYEDDALDSKKSISAFNKLISIDKADVIVNASSGTGNALAPLAEAKKIPLISVASDSKIVEGRRYPFLLWVTPEEEAKALLPEALKRGYKRIAVIKSAHDFSYAIEKAFREANDGQLEVVLQDEYQVDDKDFRTFITKLRSKEDVDAMLVLLMAGQPGVFAKQARSLGVTMPLFGFEMFEADSEREASGGALVGAWYVNADDGTGSFVDRYRAAYPGASLFGAANGHDALMLLHTAARKDPSRESIRQYLASLKDFQGALGSFSATGDNRFTLPAAVKVVTKGGFEKLS